VPSAAIFFWTEYVADPEYIDLDTSLNPLVPCSKGAKLKGAGRDPRVLHESLIQPIQRLLAESVGPKSGRGRSHWRRCRRVEANCSICRSTSTTLWTCRMPARYSRRRRSKRVPS
jgi:hypothetical protein